MRPRPRDETDFEVDLRFISTDEAVEYILGLSGRERRNYRRIQAWFHHCARIRSDPNSMIPLPEPPAPERDRT